MQKTVGANSNVFFPLYDAHGNMVATLSRAGTGWSLSDQRSYDAWGQVRAGVANGDPSGRYCANLGHKQDDESGLIYMRARYYEPGSGRFVSEDPALYDANWFIYCLNSPLVLVDRDGKVPGSLGDQGASDEIGQELESEAGGSAFNFKNVAQDRIKSIFTSQKYNGRTITNSEARDIIHALKKDEGMGPADDLLYDFAKEMFGKSTGMGDECLGTLRQIIALYL